MLLLLNQVPFALDNTYDIGFPRAKRRSANVASGNARGIKTAETLQAVGLLQNNVLPVDPLRQAYSLQLFSIHSPRAGPGATMNEALGLARFCAPTSTVHITSTRQQRNPNTALDRVALI